MVVVSDASASYVCAFDKTACGWVKCGKVLNRVSKINPFQYYNISAKTR